jgi:xylulokinase
VIDMANHWLAFDIGTTGAKAALVDSMGHVLRSVVREYPTHTATGGVMEQDAGDWWAAVCDASRALDARNNVDAIALTGQMQDVILVNAVGDPVRRVILYSDTRAHAEAERVTEKLGADRIRELTGNHQDAGSLLAKLSWLQAHEPDSVEASARLLLGAADFVALKMTGMTTTDTTTASTTGLMNLTTRAALDETVLAELGIGDSTRLLPSITPGGQRIGELTDRAAKALGLPPGIPVHHGPGDAGAATIGAGSGEIGTAYAYLGTSGWIAFTAAERARPGQGVITLAHPAPGRYIQVAPLLTAGGNLEWVRDLFGGDNYDDLISNALGCAPSRLLYLPYLNGERSPFSDPHARGAFVGLQANMSRSDLCRAVLEGVAYAYRHALDALAPKSTTTLTFTGGGTRSRLWCQLFSDIIRLPIAIQADAENVGVRGAILAAQVASAERTIFAAQEFSPIEVILQPDPKNVQHFDQQYRVFRDSYPALKAIFERLASTP